MSVALMEGGLAWAYPPTSNPYTGELLPHAERYVVLVRKQLPRNRWLVVEASGFGWSDTDRSDYETRLVSALGDPTAAEEWVRRMNEAAAQRRVDGAVTAEWERRMLEHKGARA